jgi:hypothetical protein
MRYIRLRARLEEVRGAYPDLGLCTYEQAHQRGGAATEYAIGCATTIQAWCAEHGIEHAAVHSATLKRWATGNGRASKDDMTARAQAVISCFTENVRSSPKLSHDEADAIHLWNRGCEQLAGSRA